MNHCRYCEKPLPDYATITFCPFCGQHLSSDVPKNKIQDISLTFESTAATLVPGHAPQEEPIQFSIGPYHILRLIGKGGMGEVYLAYDTTCGRRIALKRIRADLVEYVQMHRRFLKEARITSQLTHPSIIPIYAIHDEAKLVYYTMPYVQGETLKQILNKARQKEKLGRKMDPEESIPSLVHIFLSICQAVGYAHSKGVLHRDLKPENIIIGKYGEVLILDWGLAKLMPQAAAAALDDDDSEEDVIANAIESHPLHALTNVGKVVGTLNYMAPERALGLPASFHTDIYALGVMLYQILTLRYPFFRKNLKHFKQNMHLERLYDPIIIAPYRDVPELLAKIVVKALARNTDSRYQSVDELVQGLKNYIEGRSEWCLAASLGIDNKEDWEFQENVLIAEHLAITRGPETSTWVSLMVSKKPFDQNIKIEASVLLGGAAEGIGFLFNVPEAPERIHLNDGYTLWLGSDLNPTTKLSRSMVEVLHASEVVIKRNQWVKVTIENINNHIHLYLDDELQLSYHGLLPLLGTHLGLLSKDADFQISPIKVYTGGQSLTLTCLAVPDAFLAHKDYKTALSEYRRIGHSFPGRAEGREALFRSGMTLLEKAKATPPGLQRDDLIEETFTEFEKLHNTPGAPLEYLGKAIAYQAISDGEEELKCLELALRRYRTHPLLPTVEEHILYRMHESSSHERSSTYNFLLLVLRHMPETSNSIAINNILTSLENNWEPLPFIEAEPECAQNLTLRNIHFSIQLAFWIDKPYTLQEICDTIAENENPSRILLGNALYSLIEMGQWESAKEKILELKEKNIDGFELLDICLQAHTEGLKTAALSLFHHQDMNASKSISCTNEERVALYLMQKALDENDTALALEISTRFLNSHTTPQMALQFNACAIWAHLHSANWNLASAILNQYSTEALSQESSILHFLYGCWLYATEEKDIALIHFSTVLETLYPHSWMLFSHYNTHFLEDTENAWRQKILPWEKKQLLRQQALFELCEKRSTKRI